MAISRVFLLSAAVCAAASTETFRTFAREESLLQENLKDTRLGSHWIYDDVELAMSRARDESGPRKEEASSRTLSVSAVSGLQGPRRAGCSSRQ